MAEKKEVSKMKPWQECLGRLVVKRIARVQALLYRLSDGRIGGAFNGGQVALVTMRRRETGRYQTLPLVYAEDGQNVFFAASVGGMSRHPNWYHHLVACPRVIVQIGARRRKMKAREVESEEEARLIWGKLDEVYPDFAEYRERAALSSRRIPLFVMEPRSE